MDGCRLPSCRGLSSGNGASLFRHGGSPLLYGAFSHIVRFSPFLPIPLSHSSLMDIFLTQPTSIMVLLISSNNRWDLATPKPSLPTNGPKWNIHGKRPPPELLSSKDPKFMRYCVYDFVIVIVLFSVLSLLCMCCCSYV